MAPIPHSPHERYSSPVVAAPGLGAKWPVSTAVALVAIMLVLTLAGGLGVEWTRAQQFEPVAETLLIGAVLAAAYLIVLALVWVVARSNQWSTSAAIGLKRVSVGSVLAWGFGLAIAGRMIAGVWAILVRILGIRLPGAEVDPTQAFGGGWAGVLVTVLIGVVLAPVVEEVVFRGVLMPALDHRFGQMVAVIASSAMFAAVHLYAYTIPPIFVLALLLAVSFVRTKSLWAPIAAHALFNGVGIALVYAVRGLGVM